jgi:PKD repeat protein
MSSRDLRSRSSALHGDARALHRAVYVTPMLLLLLLVLGVAGTTSRTPVAQAQVGGVSTNGPYSGTVGQTIFMSASVSAFGAVGIQWFWSFGDGTNASGQTVQKAYNAPGVYTVTVQVQTSTGGSATGTTTATITGTGGITNNQVSAGGPYSGVPGQPVTMSGTLLLGFSATAFQWFWNFGDGSTGSGQTVQKTYTNAGTYTVTLQVQTAQGVASATTTATISGTGTTTGQVSAGGPYTGAVGQAITMNGSLNLLGVSVLQWLWNFGDGTSGSGQTVQKTYTAAGTYTVTLQVQTSQGVTNTATTTATIGGTGTTPGATTTVSLVTGCNNVAATWANGTPTSTVAAAVSPAGAVTGIWKLDPNSQRYLGFAPLLAQAVSDLVTVNFLDALFICTNSSATMLRPVG